MRTVEMLARKLESGRQMIMSGDATRSADLRSLELRARIAIGL